MRFGRVALVLALATHFACAGGGSRRKPGEPEKDESPPTDQLEDPDHAGALSTGRGENMPNVTFGESAEDNWKLGEAAFADEDYLAAQRYYSYVRTKFPYSQYAALSDLRIGDCQFQRGRHIEAIDSYQNFIRMHPTHERVPYALYRQGLSFYEQIPSDWFLMPPAEEKEQAQVRDAERVLRDYVERFPEDASIEDGKKLLTDVRKKLLAHERYVANFYKRLGKDRAYVGRLQVIRKTYPDVGLDDALLLEIAGVYSRLGEPQSVQDAVKEMETKFPKSQLLPEARSIAQNTKSTEPEKKPPEPEKKPTDPEAEKKPEPSARVE
jgi:outer membrane protein assembly factor BamD